MRKPTANAGPDGRVALVEQFFDGTGQSYDAMVHWATLGIDRLWKRRMVAAVPPNAQRILDLACGTGISTLAIARARPESELVGVELRDEYLAVARRKLREQPRRNVSLVLSRAEDFRSATPFDCISSSYLAKYADLPRLIDANCSMLKPGGVLLMHDFTLPPVAFLRGVWRAYFFVMQQTVARALPSWREIYHGLPRLIESTRWVSELPPLLRERGFRDISVEYLTLYGSALVRARYPG
ncbi:MAG: class I SAM-dependent methyltransferase [Pseudomonadota bacterium]|nr:class I SAM-dependent methyltransferase [Pseudomonadota bacterium]